jgi:putative acetyltransferase
MPIIRSERPRDVGGIRHVNRTAFDSIVEADIVEALRTQAQPFVSLVAVHADDVIGHIAFSPVTLASHPDVPIAALAPMAVLPSRQRAGIGSLLVRAGLDECARLGFVAVVVLGHAEYYPRFGFVRASTFGLSSEFDVPDDVFMALELQPGTLGQRHGVVRYHPAFGSV